MTEPFDTQSDDGQIDGSQPDVVAGQEFRAARDLLLDRAERYESAYREFRWPRLHTFNWAVDWFDGVLAAERPDQTALWIVEEDGTETKLTFAALAARSAQLAAWLRNAGVRRHDRVLVMLGNEVALWETMLAAIKIGAVVIPATTLLGPDDVRDRIERGDVRHVITRSSATGTFAEVPGGWTRIAVGDPVEGWLRYDDSYEFYGDEAIEGRTEAADPLLLYFTSGTTARPKLVQHTHASYPIGHLSTMYWLGLRPGDVHLNISSPGWAKHAWSNFFAPWNAGATVLVVNYSRFSAQMLLNEIVRCGVQVFCAPPTVWRMLIQADLAGWRVPLRECVAAGEPLNPEVIEQVRAAWGLTVRDGYGQTETTAQIGNTPGQPVKPGSMGRPLPGYAIVLADATTGVRLPADAVDREGEICLETEPDAGRPLGLMAGYRDADERTSAAIRHGLYHTGDVATRDADGYLTYVGRTDDVFKASDYRISPFELESVLLEHEAVAEAAVVPSPDPVRMSVPKAYVVLAAGHQPTADTAYQILRYSRQRLAPYQRVRRIEFAELPKTISGKIRRVELRGQENDRHAGSAPLRAAAARQEQAAGDRDPAAGGRAPGEFWEEDFPDLKSG